MFANNTTTFTLTDGILTKADSDVGGEITGFVALPADAIGAYFTAFGNLFTSFKASSSNASAAALANAQWQLCKAAITANPIQGVVPHRPLPTMPQSSALAAVDPEALNGNQ